MWKLPPRAPISFVTTSQVTITIEIITRRTISPSDCSTCLQFRLKLYFL
uniref:Uncharacterized protein n=2 Tax=unclassified Rosemountvirus TaxID=2738372 RepID=A0AAU8GGE0_9CAUD